MCVAVAAVLSTVVFLQQHRRALSPRTGVVASRRLSNNSAIASRRLPSSSKHRNKNRTEQIGGGAALSVGREHRMMQAAAFVPKLAAGCWLEQKG
ncbi:hypothetical protein SDJN03_27887, partial [Cucurbita argyrosperma subsp. sororia]